MYAEGQMLDIVIVPKEVKSPVEFEGIKFSKCTFVDILIDGTSIEDIADVESGVIFWPELKKSCEPEGKYLLFTCYCSIPDDAGWDYIFVEHKGDNIIWHLNRDNEKSYSFNRASYIEQVTSCEKLMNLETIPFGYIHIRVPKLLT